MNSKLFVLIGVQKAGTTTIYNTFDYCNDVYSPNYLKDYHLFLHPKKNKQIINKYRSSEKPVSLHCGVNYINSKNSILEILKFDPKTKFILILRNPINRAKSGFTYAKRMGIEYREFIDAVKYELERTNDDISFINSDKEFLKPGLYYKLIKNNLLPYVSRENIGIFIFEEIFRNNETCIDEIIKFMGIERYEYPKSLKKNIKGEAKFKILNKLLYHRSSLKTKVSVILPPKVRVQFKELIYNYNYKSLNTDGKDDFDDKLLVEYYKQDVANLSKLLNKNLNILWLKKNNVIY